MKIKWNNNGVLFKRIAKSKKSQLRLAIDLNMKQNTILRYENLEREADY